MHLLSEEQEILTSNGNKIILTDRRIQLTDRVWGKSYQITLFLEDISSIENLYKNNIFYLALAIISLLVGVISIGNERASQLMVGGLDKCNQAETLGYFQNVKDPSHEDLYKWQFIGAADAIDSNEASTCF